MKYTDLLSLFLLIYYYFRILIRMLKDKNYNNGYYDIYLNI